MMIPQAPRFQDSDSDDIFKYWTEFPDDSQYNHTVPLNQFSVSSDLHSQFERKDSFIFKAEEDGTASSVTDKKEVEVGKDVKNVLSMNSLFSENSLDAENYDGGSENSKYEEKEDISFQQSEMKDFGIYHRPNIDEELIPQKRKKAEKKKIKKNGDYYKSDAIKNMWVSTWKITIKAFHSSNYIRIAERMCHKCNTSYAQVSRYYKPKMNELISLQNLRQYLDYKQEANREEKPINKAFNKFYVWFMHNRYTLHIVQSEDIQHKEIYLKGKNKLVYLPNIKIDPKSRRIKKMCRRND